MRPDFPEAHFNLGNVLKSQNRHVEAIAAYRRAVELAPDYAKAHYNLANTLRESQMLSSAVAAYGQTLILRPDWVDVRVNLGNTHYDLGQLDSAIAVWQSAAARDPNVDLDGSLANALVDQGRLSEARSHYRREVQRYPDRWLRRLRLETLAEPIPPSRDYIDQYRCDLLAALDRYGQQPRAVPLAELHTSGAEPPMALAYHGQNDLPIKARYAELFAPLLAPADPPPRHDRPHVGIVVTHGHEGVFAKCLGGLVERLPTTELKVTVICCRAGQSWLRQQLANSELSFLPMPERIDEAAEQLRSEGFDLLHYWEVGSDSTNYFLPYLRPAPIQSATWGWPVSTGNPRTDYFVSSRLLEGGEGPSHYSERLVLLDALPTYYRRPAAAALESQRALPSGQRKAHVYLCPQNLRKYHPDFDALLAAILDADPAARIAIIADPQPHVTELLLRRLRPKLGRQADRLEVLPRMTEPAYLAALASADVVLDTPHYGGGANTIYDTLAVGTPLVTLPGEHHRTRWAQAACRKLGIPEMVATGSQQYVELAVRTATDSDYRQQLRARILAAADVLFADGRAVEELRQFFLQAIEANRAGGFFNPTPLNTHHFQNTGRSVV